ncbi:MAG: hypothetical protein IPK26_26165 [Planctomycetes bacterium]|nr:hypothetical protein [Planctomycetota bacterium]
MRSAVLPGVAIVALLLSTADLRCQSMRLIAWNDLGMHCMDSDYSVFSILPPFNSFDAQLIGADGRLVRSAAGLTLTYEAVADPSGSINRSSTGKTNFWQFAPALYGGSATPDLGLAGFAMPGPTNTPRAMAFDTAAAVFHATGVPITPYDDARHKRPYPLMRVRARSAAGALLATADVVLPVSDEMDCRLCHGSTAGPAAMPAGGWVHDADSERDYRLNILRRHDERHAGQPVYTAALAQAGYLPGGLFATANAGTPILCAACHRSNALPGTGIAGISPLTAAVHSGHADVVDPISGLTLEASANRASCYRCHPGSDTRCLRGAMGNAVAADGSRAMQCQSCHGSMATVGHPAREGWFDEPNCQNCHTGTAMQNNGQIRYVDAFTAPGVLRTAVDPTFATQPDTPLPGKSLYRFSAGHGGLRCEACHGSTHAEYPGAHANDNLQVLGLQGHVGTLSDCAACHSGRDYVLNGGPHGMHSISSRFVDDHADLVERNGGPGQCRACHGADYRGTVLSQAQGDRTFSTHFGVKTFARGARIGCYECHNGPNSSNTNANARPVAQNATATCGDQAVALDLVATDPNADPLTFRILSQPAHGTVALAGRRATYFPEAGFAGVDTFTFVAHDAAHDSAPGVVSVTRQANRSSYGLGYPGAGGVVPDLAADANPVLGTTVHLLLANPAAVPALAVFVAAPEAANLPTGHGGALLVEPDLVVGSFLPAGGLALPMTIPATPQLLGATLHVQALSWDTGARFGIAFSRGLRLVPGS